LTELKECIISHWKGVHTIQGVTCSESLRFLLAIPDLWLTGVLECVRCIHNDVISNTGALTCVADIRGSVLSIKRLALLERSDVVQDLREVAEECIVPLSDPEKLNVSSAAFVTCLELIPAIIGSLHALAEEDAVDDLLDNIFNIRWEQQHVLPMTNLMSELYPFLSTRHLESLKVPKHHDNIAPLLNARNFLQYAQQMELINSAKELPNHSEDFAGVIRVALRLFEQRYPLRSRINAFLLCYVTLKLGVLFWYAHSNDPQWMHVLRILYRAVPSRSILDVERMLEEVFQEFALASQHLVDALEDAAVCVGRAVVGRTFHKRVLLSLATESVAMYDGVPVISHYDLRLAMIVTRAVNCAGRRAGSWQGMFPACTSLV
jgi:hypothetical protein